jgi:hypothetical protein
VPLFGIVFLAQVVAISFLVGKVFFSDDWDTLAAVLDACGAGWGVLLAGNGGRYGVHRARNAAAKVPCTYLCGSQTTREKMGTPGRPHFPELTPDPVAPVPAHCLA